MRHSIFLILVSVFTLSFFLTSCSSSQSDLVTKDLCFDSDNVLNVTVKNEGEDTVPADKGSVSIFIDGRPIGGYAFSNLSDQSFRNPGDSITIRTNFRMSGTGRRIAVFVDSENEIDETNEFQNTLSRTMTPPMMSGPDFIVSDLMLGTNNELKIEVKNIGSANSASNLSVRMRIIVNENVAADLSPPLPSLAAGTGSTIITPSPQITIYGDSNVRVLLNTNNLFDETDNTNNVREELLPDGPSLAPYGALISIPQISDNIIWQGIGGVEPWLIKDYNSWSESRKTDLRNAIIKLESGESQDLSSPPVLVSDDYFSSTDAWKIYIAHIAQSLWIEVHNVVPWSLTDLTDEELSYLLDSRKLLSFSGPINNRYMFSDLNIGRITAWNPRICYEFLSNLKMIKPTQHETIYALTDWMRGHLGHIFSGQDLTDLFGYAGHPPADKMLYPLEEKHHVSDGCWGTSGFYAAVLRSVNIPVKNEHVQYGESLHSRPFFPTIDRGLAHGDDVYTAPLTPSGAVIPSPEIFYTSAEINTKFTNPAVDCAAGNCNTTAEQASYNKGKDHMQLAYNYMTDYILYLYSYFGAGYLNDSLRGPRVGGSVQEYAKPYFTEAERNSMVAAVESNVQEIGDGDLETGKSKVIERRSRFLQNK